MATAKMSINDMQLQANPKAESAFCKAWPAAKIALTAFKEMTGNFFLKTIASAIIAAMTTFAKTKCKV